MINKEDKPKIVKHNGGGYYLYFNNGIEIGPFKVVDEFNVETGTYRIEKMNGSIGYVDLIGRVLLSPLKTSKVFADYLDRPITTPYRETYEFVEMTTAVKYLPTIAFRDVEFVAAVQEEERRRKQEFVKHDLFRSFHDADRYECLYKKVIDEKQADALLMITDRRMHIAKVFYSMQKERNLLREARRRHIAKIFAEDNRVREKAKKDRKLHIAQIFHEMYEEQKKDGVL